MIDGLTVFYDHADEKRRYVIPETPQVEKRPEPMISLHMFRSDTQTGGLLQFESVLKPQESQLETVREKLAERGILATLTRPDWRSGSIRVAGWLNEDELAPLSLFVGKPSLLGDPNSVITARLDQNGAALASEALHGNALPTVLIYELETLALSGKLGITAEADLHAIHERLTAQGALTTPYGHVKISKTWEDFAKDNLIRINVVDESGDVEGQRAEAMRRIGQDLVSKMFSPFPPNEKPPLLDDGTIAPIELSFRMTIRKEELQTTSRWSFQERRAVPIKHYAAASLVDLLGDSKPENHINTVDLDTATRSITVRVEQELDVLLVASVKVDLNWHDSEEIDHTVIFTKDDFEEKLDIQRPLLEPLKYRVHVQYDPTKTHALPRQTEWMTSINDLLVIPTRDLFPSHAATFIIGNAEFDWLNHIEIKLGITNEPSQSLILNTNNITRDVFFPAYNENDISYTIHWQGIANEPEHTSVETNLTENIVVLDSPFDSSINIMAVPLPLQDILTIIVEFKSGDDEFKQSKTISWDLPDRDVKRIGLRRMKGNPRTYSYQVTYINDSGEEMGEPWITTDKNTLVIGSTEPVTVFTTEVVLLGGGPTLRNSFAIELVLQADDHNASTILEQDQDSAVLTLVLGQDDPSPVLIIREFLNSGERIEKRIEDPGELFVLPPIQHEN